MKRKLFSKLIEWKKEKKRKPLILKGVRQVGKTYLLQEFGKTFPSCHYFNFEKEPTLSKVFEKDLIPKRILTELSFHVGKTINPGTDLIIFDEIQESPKALTSLKYFQEDCENIHICAAGSLLGLHLNHASFPVGKVTFETLHPMSFEEFLMALNDKSLPFLREIKDKMEIPEIMHSHLFEQLLHYFVVGGLPEVISIYLENKDNLFEAFEKVRKKQEDLLNAYYADIAKHSGKVNAMHIDRVFKSVPAQLSQTRDDSTAKFRFRGVVPGVSHYDRLASAIDWLEATGLIFKVHIVNSGRLPLQSYTKENFFKLLLFDIGILGCMCQLSPKTIIDANYGSFKGFFVENFIAQELVFQGKEPLYNWHEGTSEIEFLLQNSKSSIPIEVKSGNKLKSNSLKMFCEKYDPPYAIIFSAHPFQQKMKIFNYPLETSA